MKIINGIRSIIFNIVFYAFCLIYFLLLALSCFYPSERPVRVGILWYCYIARMMARVIMGIKVEYRGLDKLPKDQPLILLSKHQSYFDPMLAYMVRSDVTALAKKELFSTPFLGTILRKIGIIRVDRQSRKAHEAMPAAGKEVVKSSRALIVYPEATRVPVGEKRKLKSGAYYLQVDHDLAVYPVSSNAGMFWSKGFWHSPGTVVYEVGDPFPKGLSKEDFMAKTAEAVVGDSDRLMIEGGLDPAVLAN